MKTVRWTLLLLPFLLTMACRQESPEAGASASAGTSASAESKAFHPPEDGRLTAEQVEMYVAVRTKAQGDAPAPAREPGDIDAARLAAFVTADLEAARELGYDPEEYRWVRGRVIEARPPTANEVPPELAQAVRAASLEGLKRLRDRSEDPEVIGGMDAQIASTESSRADGPPRETRETEARAFNESLLSRYANELESLDAATRASGTTPPGP